jgi:hypothetical protein
VGERADADEIDAGLRVGPHVLNRDAARRLDEHARRVVAHEAD